MKKYTFHIDREEPKEPTSVFVADWDSIGACAEGRIMVYAPIGQHTEADIDYVKNDCKEITKEEYMKISEGIYTPEEYLNVTDVQRKKAFKEELKQWGFLRDQVVNGLEDK